MKLSLKELQTRTDDEINIFILERYYGKLGSDKDILRIYGSGRFRYCTSWEHTGPIIEANKIGICFNEYEGDHNLNCWEASTCHNYQVATHKSNPLRAACEVYLMLKGE
jgi:hypothetical protein